MRSIRPTRQTTCVYVFHSINFLPDFFGRFIRVCASQFVTHPDRGGDGLQSRPARPARPRWQLRFQKLRHAKLQPGIVDEEGGKILCETPAERDHLGAKQPRDAGALPPTGFRLGRAAIKQWPQRSHVPILDSIGCRVYRPGLSSCETHLPPSTPVPPLCGRVQSRRSHQRNGDYPSK